MRRKRRPEPGGAPDSVAEWRFPTTTGATIYRPMKHPGDGSPFPFIPPEMRTAFAKLSEWVYGTRPDAPWLYEIRKYVREAGTEEFERRRALFEGKR